MSTSGDDTRGATPPPRGPDTIVYPHKSERSDRVMLVEGHEGETWIADLRGDIAIPEDEWQ